MIWLGLVICLRWDHVHERNPLEISVKTGTNSIMHSIIYDRCLSTIQVFAVAPSRNRQGITICQAETEEDLASRASKRGSQN